jgi:hypothetical protein
VRRTAASPTRARRPRQPKLGGTRRPIGCRNPFPQGAWATRLAITSSRMDPALLWRKPHRSGAMCAKPRPSSLPPTAGAAHASVSHTPSRS